MGVGQVGNDKDGRLCCCEDASSGGEGEPECPSSLPLSAVRPLPLASV